MTNKKPMRRALHAAKSVVRDARDFGLPYVWRGGANARAKFIDVNVRGVGALRIRPQDSDLETIRQIFIAREYDIPSAHGAAIDERYNILLSSGALPVIIDAGANIGAAALWFARKFPEAAIVSIEPDASNASLCRHNTKALANVRVIEGAVGARPGYAQLTNPTGQSWGVQTTRSEDAENGVPIWTMAQALASAGPHAKLFIAKIDIEGFERELFEDNIAWIDDADVILIEPHDWMSPGQGSSASFRAALCGKDTDMLIRGENLAFIRRDILPSAHAAARSARAIV